MLIGLVMTSVGSFPYPDDDLKGHWVRRLDLIDDNPGFQGNIIEIFSEQNFLQGRLVWITSETSEYGYHPGDVKWQNIQRVEENVFVFKGMLIRTDLSNAFNGPFYIDCKLTVLDDRTIAVQAFSEDYQFIGKEQVWEKVDPS